ncbi:MAG: FGGY family carbohydrate kinase, partial [Acidobacteriota bacterium]
MIFIGIDCGTQSLKVLSWRSDTNECVSASCSYGLIPGLPPGHKEQHPREWIEALGNCIFKLKGKGVRMDLVRGIGVSGQQHGLVVLDGQDHVIRPSKLWNDTSTLSQCGEILERAGGGDEYAAEIGNSLPPGFTASKILWIKENEPSAYGRIRSIMLPHDYLNFYLTGEKTAEAGDASGTGYFRVSGRIWSEKALSWIDPDLDLLSFLPGLI